MEEKPVRTLMVLPAEMHRTLRALAALKSKSMNDLVVSAVGQYLETNSGELDLFVDGWLRSKTGFGLREHCSGGNVLRPTEFSPVIEGKTSEPRGVRCAK